MPNSTCRECVNCLQQFCDCCDTPFLCVECGEPLCESCGNEAHADDERHGLCYTCFDPWLSHVQYLGQDKHFVARNLRSRRGTLRE